MREITDQLDTHRGRCREQEGLCFLPGVFGGCVFGHVFPFAAPRPCAGLGRSMVAVRSAVLYAHAKIASTARPTRRLWSKG